MKVGKPVLHTLIYYVVAFATVIYIEKSGNFRSGPCTPNLDIFAPLMFFIISVIMMIVNVTKAIRQRGDYIMAAGIHVLVVVGLIIWGVVMSAIDKH
jgi:hypothetical protein